MLRAYKEGAHIRTPLNKTPISKADTSASSMRCPPTRMTLFRCQRDFRRHRAAAGQGIHVPEGGNRSQREWDPARVRQLVQLFLATPAVTDLADIFRE